MAHGMRIRLRPRGLGTDEIRSMAFVALLTVELAMILASRNDLIVPGLAVLQLA